jgi:peptide/nickel transport system permease protein
MAANPIGVLGAGTILVVALVALVANALAPFDPTAQIARPLQSPGGQYLLGTDEFGRDVLSRLMFGSRISLYVGFVSVAIGLSVGGAVGVVAGYYGGKVDAVLMRVVESLFAFPSLLLAIAIAGILGASLTHAMLAIGIVFVPRFARLARGSVLTVVGLDYVGAARALGAGDWPIIRRHVLPNVLAPLIVQTTLALSGAILTEASLSFLGWGRNRPTRPGAPCLAQADGMWRPRHGSRCSRGWRSLSPSSDSICSAMACATTWIHACAAPERHVLSKPEGGYGGCDRDCRRRRWAWLGVLNR